MSCHLELFIHQISMWTFSTRRSEHDLYLYSPSWRFVQNTIFIYTLLPDACKTRSLYILSFLTLAKHDLYIYSPSWRLQKTHQQQQQLDSTLQQQAHGALQTFTQDHTTTSKACTANLTTMQRTSQAMLMCPYITRTQIYMCPDTDICMSRHLCVQTSLCV